MVQDKQEKFQEKSAREDWSPDELQRLYNVVKDFAKNTKRIISWDKLIKDYFPWDEVDLENRTKEETKDALMELLDKQYVRHYRLLNELMDDLTEKAEKALPPFIPDPPKKPCSTFMLFSMTQHKKIREKNPDSQLGAIGKIMGEAYQSLSEKKKKKLEERHQQLMDEYHKEYEEYLSKYPQMVPVLRGDRKAKQPLAPPKQPTSMYMMICQDVRSKMKEEFGRDVTFKEAKERVGKNYQHSLSPEEKKYYEEIYNESMKKYEQELAHFRARHPEVTVETDAKKKKTQQKEKPVKKEVIASDSEDSDFIEPKTKKAKSALTKLTAMNTYNVNNTDSKKKKLRCNDSEEEKIPGKKDKIEEEKVNGKVPKKRETGSENSDSEDEKSANKPKMKPVNQRKRKVLEKNPIGLKGVDSEESHDVRTKKNQNKQLVVSAKADESESDTEAIKKTTLIPKSTVSLARKTPPEQLALDSSDDTDEAIAVVKSSTAKSGNGERNIQSVKLQRNKDPSSKSEDDGGSCGKEPSKKKGKSDYSDSTTPSPPPVKFKKNARGDAQKKVQKRYLSISEMKKLKYNELIDALKKVLPGFPSRSSLGALDVFMEIYPITKDLQNARKKFKRLEPKEQEEIISMYRQEQDDYQIRIKQFFAGLDQEEKAFLKLAAPLINEKMEAFASEYSVEGQSEDEN